MFSGPFYFCKGRGGGMIAIALEAKSFGRLLRYIMVTATTTFVVALGRYISTMRPKLIF